jgi:hypothetical protein
MENKSETWQDRFALTTCAAAEIDQAIPLNASGVAVIYAESPSKETVFLVLESRTSGLRNQCARRLQTAKFPVGAALKISFRAEVLATKESEEMHAACRQQVILAGELRRELRPAMR